MASAIFQNPVFQCSTCLRVPSGASANHSLSARTSICAAWPTVPCGASRSIGITPSLRNSTDSGHQNSCRLPSTVMRIPSASLAANPHSPSQLEECGAAINTALGRSGIGPTTRQPPSLSTVRPNQRAKRL